MDAAVKRKLISSDGKTVEVEDSCFKLSKVLSNLVNDFPEPEKELPINDVTEDTLKKIITYLEHYKDPEVKPKDIPKPLPGPDLKLVLDDWDFNYITPLSLQECVDLINGANYLDIPELVTLVSARLASEMLNCEVEEARAKFGIESDMTQEEMDEYDKYPLD